jgi:hypothetical protein
VVNALQEIFSTRTCIARSHYLAGAADDRGTAVVAGMQGLRCNNSPPSRMHFAGVMPMA